MDANAPKFVGFDATIAVLTGAQGVLTMTSPHNFIAKRLVMQVFDTATGGPTLCRIERFLWNNQELKAGGPILSTAFPSGFTTNGSNGWPVEFTLNVKTADQFNIVITNLNPATIAVVAWWTTDFGKGCLSCG